MKKVLISGASDGIGRSIAIRLAKDNYSLIICGRDESRLNEVASECGNNAHVLAFDINDGKARKTAIDAVEGVDILINNAGVWHKVGDLETLSDEKIVEVINTNLTSQIMLTKQLLPKMKDREDSAVINVISKSGIKAQQGQTVYTASKYGMRGFTDVLREDTNGNALRVGAVYQSGTNTKMFEKAGEDFPVETFTEPDDLADVIAFMLSRPKKLWINEVSVDK